MNRIQRSALINYSAKQMYDLVNDVAAYPQYMPGCVGAEVLASGDGWLEARLDLKKAGFSQSFVTRNTLVEAQEMHMELVSGPFKHFSGNWQFTTLEEAACKVGFSLEYEFSNKLLAFVTKNIFEQVASDQVKCLCDRAKEIYG